MLEGIYQGIDQGWFQSEIADSAYAFEQKLSTKRRHVVGVTAFTEGSEEEPPPILHIGQEVEELQGKRLADVKSRRSSEGVAAALAEISRTAADPARNLMPVILDAVGAYATVGEIMDAMAGVFGRWRETPTI
jgi:methylmalonyl-CoA mutase N-terminal domain/subunit